MSDTPRNNKTKSRGGDYIVQGSILAAAAVITKVIGVVYRIPLTNLLGDEGNGFYGYAYQVYAFALMISSLSLPTAVSKIVSMRVSVGQRRNAFRAFLCSLVFAIIIGFIIAVAIFFGAGAISEHVMKAPLSVYALKVLAPGLFIVAVMAVLRGYFQGLGTMMPTAVSQVIEQLINAVVSIVGAGVLFGIGTRAGQEAGEELLGPAYGAAGGTLGTVTGAFAGLLFLLFVLWLFRGGIKRQLKRDHSKKKEAYSHILKALILTAVPVIFSTAIYNINQIIDLTVFNHIMSWQGFSEQEYMALQGIYTGKYDPLINVPLSIPSAVSASIVPTLTAAVMNRQKKKVHYQIDQTLRIATIITIPSCVGIAVLASPLMVLLYNDSSATPANLLMLGAIVIVLYGWSSITNSVLHGLNYMSSPAKNAAVALVVHLIAFVVMLVAFRMNVYALVGSNIVFALIMCILNQLKIRKVCGYKINIRHMFLKPFIAAAVMGVVTYIIWFVLDLLIGGRVIPTVIAICVAIVVYIVLILKMGTLSEEDILSLPLGGKLLRYSRKFHLVPEAGDSDEDITE
ncbi:putative polysaccharide biosynthesis protein [Mediterraneibacter glycyrrhizinilyticus]|uniref:putative polysaccharide biosynthesis protein n=1 Tax=Mediterraneibacter glycyrrhizinilyticus TaxID=342942 RepID=UPI0025A475BF|nr:polysaccharide biosynthesis protein [Mediterraneibacter glycyrrhizinilyticus]MDM8211562.1 polysaccharide biosynthesis protein [Mediterraneibacter glycyrrhizinilyticus]